MNYSLVTEEIIANITKDNKIPKLLIHSCCAPCSSYVIEYLSNYFEITILYYNPNIYPYSEYDKRVMEQEKFIKEFNTKYKVSFVPCEYNYSDYTSKIKGYENDFEGGTRCLLCYTLRMEYAARYGKEHNFDYFTTTLTISPHKNSKKINEIGAKLEEEYKIKYLYSDFKKKNGYKRSCELSSIYGLYRQDYCGCVYSKKKDKVVKNVL